MTPVSDGEIIGTVLGGATIAVVTTRIVGGVPDHSRDGSDTSRGREHDRAKYQSRDDVNTSDYNSQNPRPRGVSTSPIRRVDEALKPRSN